MKKNLFKEKENIKNQLFKNPKNDSEEEIESIKVIVLGEPDVGKYGLINDLIGDNCSEHNTKKLYFSDINRSLKFKFYDKGGIERYTVIAKAFYKDA